jgi:hypothetical protein
VGFRSQKTRGSSWVDLARVVQASVKFGRFWFSLFAHTFETFCGGAVVNCQASGQCRRSWPKEPQAAAARLEAARLQDCRGQVGQGNAKACRGTGCKAASCKAAMLQVARGGGGGTPPDPLSLSLQLRLGLPHTPRVGGFRTTRAASGSVCGLRLQLPFLYCPPT